METTISSMLESIQDLRNLHLPKTSLLIEHKLDLVLSDILELQDLPQIDTYILNNVPEIVKFVTGYDSKLIKVTSEEDFEFETFEFRIAGKFIEEEIAEITSLIESGIARTKVKYIQ